ncbi:MAG: hypothetical protein LBS99_02005 [Clostridiales bacterium]|jgi:hypothetical protein|nr:hypothetical protein [Clostridiales bacterium]
MAQGSGGGCLGKIFTFIFGMIFGVVVFLGAIAGIGYYAVSGPTINDYLKLFKQEELLKDWEDKAGLLDNSILKLVGIISDDLVADFGNKSLDQLKEDYNIDIVALLKLPVSLPSDITSAPFKSFISADGIKSILNFIPLTTVLDMAGMTDLPGNLYESFSSNGATVGMLIDGDVDGILAGIQVGGLMGFEKVYTDAVTDDQHVHDETCPYVWREKDGSKIQAIMAQVANNYITDIIGGDISIDKIMGNITLGEIMGFELIEHDEADTDHVHTADCFVDAEGNPLRGINALVADFHFADLSDSAKFQDRINNARIGVALGYTEVLEFQKDGDGNFILDGEGEKIPAPSTWLKKDGEQETGLIGHFCGLTITGMSGSGFNDVIDGLKIDEVITINGDSNPLLLELREKQTTVATLESDVSELLNKASMEQLISWCGITVSPGASDKLNAELPDNSGRKLKDLGLEEFLEFVLNPPTQGP